MKAYTAVGFHTDWIVCYSRFGNMIHHNGSHLTRYKISSGVGLHSIRKVGPLYNQYIFTLMYISRQQQRVFFTLKYLLVSK